MRTLETPWEAIAQANTKPGEGCAKRCKKIWGILLVLALPFAWHSMMQLRGNPQFMAPPSGQKGKRWTCAQYSGLSGGCLRDWILSHLTWSTSGSGSMVWMLVVGHWNRSEHRGALEQQGVYSSVDRCRRSKTVQPGIKQKLEQEAPEKKETSLLGKLRQLKADIYLGIKAYTHAQRRYVPGSHYFSNAQISTKFTRYINKQKNVAKSKKQI